MKLANVVFSICAVVITVLSNSTSAQLLNQYAPPLLAADRHNQSWKGGLSTIAQTNVDAAMNFLRSIYPNRPLWIATQLSSRVKMPPGVYAIHAMSFQASLGQTPSYEIQGGTAYRVLTKMQPTIDGAWADHVSTTATVANNSNTSVVVRYRLERTMEMVDPTIDFTFKINLFTQYDSTTEEHRTHYAPDIGYRFAREIAPANSGASVRGTPGPWSPFYAPDRWRIELENERGQNVLVYDGALLVRAPDACTSNGCSRQADSITWRWKVNRKLVTDLATLVSGYPNYRLKVKVTRFVGTRVDGGVTRFVRPITTRSEFISTYPENDSTLKLVYSFKPGPSEPSVEPANPASGARYFVKMNSQVIRADDATSLTFAPTSFPDGTRGEYPWETINMRSYTETPGGLQPCEFADPWNSEAARESCNHGTIN